MYRWISIVLLTMTFAVIAQMPTEYGPYDVGVRMRSISRPSDTDTTTRVMDVYIWYPADPIIGFWVEALQGYWESRVVLGDTARPVVFYSHGACGHPLASVYYTSFLPSWGFVTVATMHPGSMFGEEDCLDSAALGDTWINRPGDVDFTRRWLIDLSLDSAGLFGVLDTNRIGMSGHSFGARTTYAMLNRYDYFLAGLAFSGNYVDRFGAPMNCMEDIRGISQPIMIQNGTYDFGLTHTSASEIFDTLDSPKYWVEIHRATHSAWSDTCTIELDPFCGADSVLDYEIGHEIIRKYSLAFLMRYVMGDSRFDDYLADSSDTFVNYAFDVGMSIFDGQLPKNIEILAYPNPFNSAVSFGIHRAGSASWPGGTARLEIFDLAGNLISRGAAASSAYDMQYFSAHSKWNGSIQSCLSGLSAEESPALAVWHPDENIPTGLYLARISVGKYSRTIPIVYIK